MRWLAILCVLAYRVFIRPFRRRRCLFDESCSAHGIRLFREHGVRVAVPLIRARIRSCRMPAMACFILDATGHARLFSATSGSDDPVPPRALELLAQQAELTAGSRMR
ncbi:MAG: membrane protein insertion efficiency factor YidD [Deltaproteobacteria bacterium]|nr:membrane protein insertion efficiency factor YidD [Deltaproteobacteria bacterium]